MKPALPLLAVALLCTACHNDTPPVPAYVPVRQACENHGDSPSISARRVEGVFRIRYHCPDGTIEDSTPTPPNGIREGAAG